MFFFIFKFGIGYEILFILQGIFDISYLVGEGFVFKLYCYVFGVIIVELIRSIFGEVRVSRSGKNSQGFFLYIFGLEFQFRLYG